MSWTWLFGQPEHTDWLDESPSCGDPHPPNPTHRRLRAATGDIPQVRAARPRQPPCTNPCPTQPTAAHHAAREKAEFP